MIKIQGQVCAFSFMAHTTRRPILFTMRGAISTCCLLGAWWVGKGRQGSKATPWSCNILYLLKGVKTRNCRKMPKNLPKCPLGLPRSLPEKCPKSVWKMSCAGAAQKKCPERKLRKRRKEKEKNNEKT